MNIEYKKNKISNLILREALDIKTLSEKSVDKLMENWHRSATANNILSSDNGRNIDKIRPEKSMILLNAISKAISPTMMEILKINLGNKLKNQNISTSFSCTWQILEETIQDSLGQAPNIERLNKCLEPKNWGETTLQQAFQNINNFHNESLDNKASTYKDENGELRETVKHKESMKTASAFDLLKKLPATFDIIKHEAMTDISNAYYDTNPNYKKTIEKIEKGIKQRGLIRLYTETKISTHQVPKPPIYTETKNPTNQVQKSPQKNKPYKLSEEEGRQQILEYIKTCTQTLMGDIMSLDPLRKIINKADLCKYCLTTDCRKKQRGKNKSPGCKKKLHRLENKELITNLEGKSPKTEVQKNTVQGKKENQQNENNPTNSEIKPEERFKEIPNNDDEITPEERFQEITNNDNDWKTKIERLFPITIRT